MNDFSDDDFSFKGVAPADRAGAAPGQPTHEEPAAPRSAPDSLLPPLPSSPSVPGEPSELFALPTNSGVLFVLRRAALPAAAGSVVASFGGSRRSASSAGLGATV